LKPLPAEASAKAGTLDQFLVVFLINIIICINHQVIFVYIVFVKVFVYFHVCYVFIYIFIIQLVLVAQDQVVFHIFILIVNIIFIARMFGMAVYIFNVGNRKSIHLLFTGAAFKVVSIAFHITVLTRTAKKAMPESELQAASYKLQAGL
jgi:hypothetical protein